MAKGGKSVGSNVVVSLQADSSGLAAGMNRATVATKGMVAQIKAQLASLRTMRIEKLFGGGMVGGFLGGMLGFAAINTVGVGISKLKNMVVNFWQETQKIVENFREEAHEAEEMSTALGVSTQSFYELSIAGKNVPFEHIRNLLARYNLAAMDSGKANIFAKLGLEQVAAQGEQTTGTMLNLLDAMHRFSEPEGMSLFKDLMGYKPQGLGPLLPLLGQTGIEARGRIEVGRRYGVIPTSEDIAQVDKLIEKQRVSAMLAKGIGRKVGIALTGPIDMMIADIKNQIGMALLDVMGGGQKMAGRFSIMSPLIASMFTFQNPFAGMGDLTWGGALTTMGGMPGTLLRGMGSPAAALRGMNLAREGAAAADKAQRGALAGKDFLDLMRTQVAKLKLDGEFTLALEKALAMKKAGGAGPADIEAFKKEALSLKEQREWAEEDAKKREKLKAIQEDTIPPVVKLREEMDMLNQEFRRSGDREKFQIGMDKLRQSIGLLDTPLDHYLKKLREITDASSAFLLGDRQKAQRESRARGEFLSELGIQESPLTKFGRAMTPINEAFKAGKITAAEKARGMAARFEEFFPKLPRQTPLEGLTAGSVQAAHALTQWRIDSKREAESGKEEMFRRLDEANRLNELQLEESKRIATALEDAMFDVLE